MRPAPGNPFNDGSRYFGATGLDIKYVPRPNIILNAAINPDFGQVEIDPAVVNLGAFETFFQEKRPFFIEGAQIFSNFGSLGANNRWGFNRSEPNLVHTRRLGRVPQGEAERRLRGSADRHDHPRRRQADRQDEQRLELRRARRRHRPRAHAHVHVRPAGARRNGAVDQLFRGARAEGVGLGPLRARGAGRQASIATSHDPGLARQLTGRANLAGMDGYHFLDARQGLGRARPVHRQPRVRVGGRDRTASARAAALLPAHRDAASQLRPDPHVAQRLERQHRPQQEPGRRGP